MFFIVRFRLPDGTASSVSVEAETEREAAKNCGQPKSRIISVKRDALADVKRTLLNPSPTRIDQALFLQNLASLLLSGEDVNKAITRLLYGNKQFHYDQEEIKHCITIVDYLKVLNFSDLPITLAEVGEKSGNIGDALQTAADDMLNSEKMAREMGKGLYQSALYMLIAIVLLFVLPLVLAGNLEQLMAQSKAFQPNFFTYYMVWFYQLMSQYGFIFPVIFLALYVGRRQVWDALKHQPGFSLFQDFFLLKRGLLFLDVYRSLYRAGIPDSRCMLILKSQAKGKEADIYQDMYHTIKAGKDISAAVNSDKWTDNLRFSMSSFGKMTDEKKLALLNALINSMYHQIEATSQKISRLVLFVSMIFIIIGIFSVAVGFYLPIATLKPGG